MKSSNSYSILSEIYSHIMEDVNYSIWAEYIEDILIDYFPEANNILELAAGVGTISEIFQEKGYIVFSSDKSLKMLQKSKVKNRLVFDFSKIPIKKKNDFIFCTFDSLNYILQKEKFIDTLNEIATIMHDNSIFTFDVSLENNSIQNINQLNRNGFYGNYKYSQISNYDFETKIHSNKFIIFNGEKSYSEIHKQKIYSFKEYFDMIDKSNLMVIDCFESFTFDEANENNERIQFILQRKN